MAGIDRREKNTHHGHAIKRFRTTLGMKQDRLAIELGMTQAMISNYETKKVIDDHMIKRFAKVLGVSTQLIKDLEEDPVTLIFENNNGNEKINQAYHIEDYSTNQFNPIDRIVDLFEKLLEKEQEKVTLLEELLKRKK